MRLAVPFRLFFALLLIACAGPAVADVEITLPDSVQMHLQEGAAKRAKIEAAVERLGAAKVADSWAPSLAPSTIDVIHYDLDLHLDLTRRVASGSVEVTLQAVEDDLATVTLDADLGLRVLGVILVCDETLPYDSNRSLAFAHADDQLSITLHRPLATGERVRLLIPYGGRANRGGEGVNWDYHGHVVPVAHTQAEPFGARVWWPCNDRPDDKATVDLRITAPDWMTVASNGLETGRVANADDTATTTWTHNYPVATYLVVMNATDYLYSELDYTSLDGNTTMPVGLWAYPEHNEQAISDLDFTPELIATLASRWGEYPFINEKYGNVTTPFGGGMEHQTLTTLAASVVGDDWMEYLNVHELGHQWWGDFVTCDDWRELWLNEGFASYTEWIWTELHYGEEALTQYKIDSDGLGMFTGALYDNPVLFSNTVYDKGAWVLHMLRQVVGDDDFFAAVIQYRETYGDGSATSEDLRDVFEQISDMDLEWFWQQWVYGESRPHIQYSWTEVAGPAVRLTVDQEHTNVPYFKVPMVVEITTTAGTERSSVWIEALATQTFDIDVAASPTAVMLDPDHDFLGDLSPASEPDLDLGPGYPGPYVLGPLSTTDTASVTIPMTNTGGSDLVIDTIASWGGNAFSPSLPSALPLTINPGETVVMEVEFSPNGPGNVFQYLVIVSNDPSHTDGWTFLTFRGSAGLWDDPYLTTQSSVNLGAVPVGGVSESSINISNLGVAELNVSASIDGADFAIGSVLPDAITAGTSHRLFVRFSPQTEGAHDGTLTLTSNDPNQPSITLTLTGEGLSAPRLQLDPPLVSLGIGDSSEAKTVGISNVGTEDLLISAITVDGPFVLSDSFSLPLTVNPGQRVEIEVAFDSVDTGATEGTLSVISNDPVLPSARLPIKAYAWDGEVDRWAFPAAASSGGVGGAVWATDATFLNTGEQDAAVDLTFMADSARTGAPIDLSLTIPANSARVLGDIVNQAGFTGTGGLELATTSTGLIPVSRTYSTEETGTYGQFIPALAEGDALAVGQTYVLAGLAAGGFHSNFGVLNLGTEQITVSFTLFDAAGIELGSFDLTPGGGLYAQNVAAFADFTDSEVRGGFATFTSATTGATYAAFASVVDDSSHDPTYVQPVLFASAGATDLVIPVVVSAEGDLGTRWESEMSLVNPGESTALVSLIYHPAAGDDPGSEHEIAAWLAPGEAEYLDKVVGEVLGLTDSGWFDVASDSPIVATSRTYNDDPSGTYGQAIPAVTRDQAIGTGEEVVIASLRSSDGFRSNIGVTNLGESDITVHAMVYDLTGAELGEITIAVPGLAFVQKLKVLEDLGFVGQAWAILSCDDSDAAYIAHASVVDGDTGDPYYVPAVAQPTD